MKVTRVTVGLPVRDLRRAEDWYRKVFELTGAAVEPVPGLVELTLGSIDLQLVEDPAGQPGAQNGLRVGVADAAAEHERLSTLGLDLDPVEHVPGAVDYFDFTDPDGNTLGVYSLNS
ncbi:VOC family protein [Cryobacterium sp.]|uniref:VOC family protein n=1 Tax=Cryobacterium sp. TaxID=1926290 RepID=UPI00261EA63D|nr:VOC family protein [Cryobacterium sp.]MCU1447694.1 glyoxalase [Cryobacterium sp.]